MSEVQCILDVHKNVGIYMDTCICRYVRFPERLHKRFCPGYASRLFYRSHIETIDFKCLERSLFRHIQFQDTTIDVVRINVMNLDFISRLFIQTNLKFILLRSYCYVLSSPLSAKYNAAWSW